MPPRVDSFTYLPLKTDALFVMMALEAGALHGYALIRDVSERSAGEVELQAGALYRLLRRLLDDKLIEECGAPPGESSTDERRRYYRATALGRRVLEADLARMSRVVAAARRARKPHTA
jgi:DNA-binding PadR family transcriptional regulator